MSHGHGHGSHAAHSAAPSDRRARAVLMLFLALVAVGTLSGLAALWPSADDLPDRVAYAAEGVTFVDAEVTVVEEACPVIVVGPDMPQTGEADQEFPENCNSLVAAVASGPEEGQELRVQAEAGVVRSGLEPGDDISLMRFPPAAEAEAPVYAFSHVHRGTPLVAMTVLFVVVVAVVARLRGILALVGLGFAAAIVWWFVLPGLLAGENGIAVAVVGSVLIMYVVLYLAHGPSVRTSTALAGTLLALAVTAALGAWAVGAVRLSGLSNEDGEFLQLYADNLDFRALLTAGIIIAGLGVLNDVTITQASAVFELRAAAPTMTRRELFGSGMRIGRDHIASTIYTIVFAYAGTALGLLLLLSLYDRPLGDVLSSDILSEEIVRTLASAIGLVASVPITTAIAAATVTAPEPVVREPAAAGEPSA
ncbi:YibE/F family protein [Nocardioides zeae]|uniref:YibE/F family protein n=1 Tax=Nocardioides imazamoxiresistens TaxID=3231893 RepID=A0ABU3Q1M0_9ACTN|nr:YibE/F family protein [Nocardioides zeae]MDT9595375.1 YibE/F family protein [Nocardioides zeae]